MSGFFVVSKRNGSVAKQKAQVPAGKWTWGQRDRPHVLLRFHLKWVHTTNPLNFQPRVQIGGGHCSGICCAPLWNLNHVYDVGESRASIHWNVFTCPSAVVSFVPSICLPGFLVYPYFFSMACQDDTGHTGCQQTVNLLPTHHIHRASLISQP